MTTVRGDGSMTVEELRNWEDGRCDLVEGGPRLMASHTDEHATK